MVTFSKSLIHGHTTAPVKHRFVRGDRPVADFTVAVNDSFKRGDEWIETTSYIDITCFGTLADAVKELPVGSGVYCEGRLSSETWDDKSTGRRRFRLKVIAERLRRTPSKAESNEEPKEAAKS
ncbi:MAG: hypothetical protein CMJ58_25615 [Planctomycetaceae bacterium]|nr:hypothetical protein [Planctomycetaceae bacterium]